jgi:hypothetical protein
MARLIDWPEGLGASAREPLSGPRTVGASGTQAVSGFVQTSGAAFGMWRWRFEFPDMKGQLFRRYRGWVTALHGGANATRVPWCEWDQMSLAERGVEASAAEWVAGQPWGNGQPWSNGQSWQSSNPLVPVVAAAALDATEIRLGPAFWGHGLGVGDVLGFAPFHLGWYMITRRIEPGRYTIWPPLRKALTIGDLATLDPVIAMRLESEEAANAPRGTVAASGLSVTLVEVLDYDVRDYFTE